MTRKRSYTTSIAFIRALEQEYLAQAAKVEAAGITTSAGDEFRRRAFMCGEVIKILRGKKDPMISRDVEPSIEADDIPVGTYFLGRIEGFETFLFMRDFDGVTSLQNPTDTWSDIHIRATGVTVRDYKPVDVVITVKEQK